MLKKYKKYRAELIAIEKLVNDSLYLRYKAKAINKNDERAVTDLLSFGKQLKVRAASHLTPYRNVNLLNRYFYFLDEIALTKPEDCSMLSSLLLNFIDSIRLEKPKTNRRVFSLGPFFYITSHEYLLFSLTSGSALIFGMVLMFAH